MATNHILNKGVSGIADTISFFEKRGIVPIGAGKDIGEARKTSYFYKNGFSIAFLNMSENEYCSATSRHAGSHPLDVIDNANSIKEAKSKAESVIVIIHGGLEYCRYPTPRQVKQSRFYADCGASAIIWHHSHYVSGYEIYNQCPIYYGIGNFIPAKAVSRFISDPLARYSYPVQLEIFKNGKLQSSGYPLKYDLNKGALEYLSGYELTSFEQSQNEVNALLNDLPALRTAIAEKYLTTDRLALYMMLFTRSSNIIRRLCLRMKLTDLWLCYLKWKMRMNSVNTASWNLVRCETHRDVLDIIYERFVDTYKNES